MQKTISFILDGQIKTIDFQKEIQLRPTTTVLNYLRSLPNHKGVKEGCAEGDCGACTVVLAEPGKNGNISYKAVNSCLIFLPMLHGRQLITVENLKSSDGALHPVQTGLVEKDGTQCGFCTPGMAMSIFALYKNNSDPGPEDIKDALTGNLCRCTGYKPIAEAAAEALAHREMDIFSLQEKETRKLLKGISRESIHIRTARQDYYRPATLRQALKLRNTCPDAEVISGATDVALRVTKKFELIKEIIDLSGIDELQDIADTRDELIVGAGVNLSDLLPTVRESFPALYGMFTVYGSRQVRNLATLGGNLGTASPIGDSLPVLMAYCARLMLENESGQREVSLDDYFRGYRQTVRQPDELITKIIIPRPANGTIFKSYKISKRKDLDISTVSAGFRLELNNGNRVSDIRLVFGGMADRVRRADKTEGFLLGKKWSRETVEQSMEILRREFTPISDVRGSADFRRIASRNLLLKFWSETST
ncbi:MAG: xanthine dehydrogenase small subunit [Calditrichia bacterium]